MKAAVYTRYGPPDVLEIKEVEKPTPGKDDILVNVIAATVNRTDCANLLAKPFIMRFVNGLFNPRKTIPGTDFAGIVVDTGKNVDSFKKGDRVFGFNDLGLGSHAQYLTVSTKKTIAMPANRTFEQAAASIEGAHYAYNFINKVKLKPEHKVMINGATGAIGSALVQLTKTFGCSITATCLTKDFDLVKSIGADRVIDYQKQDFTADKESYDFVFDAVGKSTFGKCKKLLKPGGRYISSELGPHGQNIFFLLFSFLMGSKKVLSPIPVNIPASLRLVKKLMEENKFTPVIDRVYPLEEITDAYRYVLTGKKVGNVIVINSKQD